MLDKFFDILLMITGLSICIPICLYFWFYCLDYVIEKLKEWI